MHFFLIGLEIILLPACLNVTRIKTFDLGEMASGMRARFVEIWPPCVCVGGGPTLGPVRPWTRVCFSEGVPGPRGHRGSRLLPVYFLTRCAANLRRRLPWGCPSGGGGLRPGRDLIFGERSWALIRLAPPASLPTVGSSRQSSAEADAGRAEIIVVLLFKNQVDSFAMVT